MLKFFNKVSTSDLQEDVLVKILFCDETVTDPTTLFRLFQDRLVLKGLRYHQYPDIMKTMYAWNITFPMMATIETMQYDSWNTYSPAQTLRSFMFNLKAM